MRSTHYKFVLSAMERDTRSKRPHSLAEHCRTDHLRIRAVDTGEVKTVAANLEPVAWSVVGVRMEAELDVDELPEGDFRGEHGVSVARSVR